MRVRIAVSACPNGAIKAAPRTGARIVDPEACVGCRLCQEACPWDMMVFDEEAGKASKCFLCHGKPKCVEACPAAALRFAPWRDTTRDQGPGSGAASVLPLLPPETAWTSVDCHAPKARKKNAK